MDIHMSYPDNKLHKKSFIPRVSVEIARVK